MTMAAEKAGARAPFTGPMRDPAHGREVSRRAAEAVAARFGDKVRERITFRGEETLVVDPAAIVEIATFLRDEPELDFDVLTDVMAAHFLERDHEYEVSYLVSSYPNNAQIRLKVRLGGSAGPAGVPTLIGVWPTADWQEREEWDKVGVVFDGHPNLTRILMPEDWEGHPLRKDYPMEGIGA